MGFDSKINNWIKTLNKSDDIFRRAVLDNEAEIIDANTAQLEIGKDSLGELFDDYATDDYADLKIALGSKAPFRTPNLFVEGDFYEGFILKNEGMTFFITSTDSKTEKLTDQYGEDIFGLNDVAIIRVSPDILESFLIIFRNGLL